MKKILTAILILLFVPATANAITLYEAAQVALEKNPDLKQTERQIEIAEQSLRSARGQKGISISASGSVSAAKTEGSSESESVSTRIRGSVPIYSGRKLESQIDSAELGLDISKLNYVQARDDLIYNVAKTYLDALENLATTKVNLETEENLADHEKNIAAMYDAGSKARIDLLRAQVETSNAMQDTSKSQAAYEVSLANLATLMSIDSITNLVVEEIEPALTLGDLEDYILMADENRSDLKADELKIEQGEFEIEIAKSNKRPTISAEVGTGLGASSNDWHLTPDASAGVSASWNIFDSGVTRAQIRDAEIRLENLRLAMISDRNSIHESVITAYKNLRIALMRLRTTQRAVALAEEERYIATEKYRAGEGILLDILDAEVALSSAKKNHVSALYDVARYRFDLAHAVGNTLAAID